MYSKWLYVVFQFIIFYSQYKSIYTNAIVGHNIRPVNEYEFPAVVCIARYNPVNTIDCNIICTGALVSPTHILTAEHCFFNLQNDALEVLLGSGHLENSLTYYPIWWLTYDQWSIMRNTLIETLYNDIAILKIIGFAPSVEPLVFSNISPVINLYQLEVQMIGCGKINETYPTVMQTTNVNVLDMQECESTVSRLERTQVLVPINYICTFRTPYAHLSEGDSGGPLLFCGDIIGVNAGVSPPMAGHFHEEKVNAHIAVDFYRDFLEYILHDL